MSAFAAGDYWCQIVSAALTESSKAKSPQITLNIMVESEAVGGDWKLLDKPVARSVHWSLTEKAWPYAEKKLAALGFNGDFNAPTFEKTHEQFFMEWETYDGKDRERWDLANWGGGDGPARAGADVIRTYNAKWKQSQQAQAKPSGKPKAPPAARRPEPVAAGATREPGDDDPAF